MSSLFALGRSIKKYGRSRAQKRLVVVISFGCTVVAALVLWAAFSGTSPLGQKVGLSILAAFFSLPAVFGVRELARARGASLELFENGFVCKKRGREFTTTWDDIASYTEHSALRVEKKDGEVIEFGAVFDGFEEVGQRIEEETCARLLPVVKATIDAGSSYVFKGLSGGDTLLGAALDKTLLAPEGFAVDASGITARASGERMAWAEVDDFGVAQGEARPWLGFFFLFIRGKERGFQTLYAAIPNAHVLLALCGLMVEPQRS